MNNGSTKLSTFGCCFFADQLKFGSVVSLLSTKLTVNNVIGGMA